jgi:hypothetical protein
MLAAIFNLYFTLLLRGMHFLENKFIIILDLKKIMKILLKLLFVHSTETHFQIGGYRK